MLWKKSSMFKVQGLGELLIIFKDIAESNLASEYKKPTNFKL
jgi:hypothetical protein